MYNLIILGSHMVTRYKKIILCIITLCLGVYFMATTQQELKQNIIDNCLILNQLFGVNNGLEIFVRSQVVVYGLLNVGKTFYSMEPHSKLSNIATYRTSITIGFISDLSKELVSMLNQQESITLSNSEISFIDYSPNRENNKARKQSLINQERVKQGLKPVNFNDKDYY